MSRRLRAVARTIFQGAYGVTIEIVALAVLFGVAALIAVVLSQFV